MNTNEIKKAAEMIACEACAVANGDYEEIIESRIEKAFAVDGPETLKQAMKFALAWLREDEAECLDALRKEVSFARDLDEVWAVYAEIEPLVKDPSDWPAPDSVPRFGDKMLPAFADIDVVISYDEDEVLYFNTGTGPEIMVSDRAAWIEDCQQ